MAWKGGLCLVVAVVVGCWVGLMRGGREPVVRWSLGVGGGFLGEVLVKGKGVGIVMGGCLVEERVSMEGYE